MTSLLPVLLLLGGGVRVDASAPPGVDCPATGKVEPELLALIGAARGRALPGRAYPDVTLTLRRCLRRGLLAEAGQAEIQLSLVELEVILEGHEPTDELVVDYLAFVLAHEARHLEQREYGRCPSLQAELEADRSAAQSARWGRIVLGDLLGQKLAATRVAMRGGEVAETAAACVNALELSVRAHALMAHVAEGSRAHHYYASNEAMHRAVTEQYEIREAVFDTLWVACEGMVEQLSSSCGERSLGPGPSCDERTSDTGRRDAACYEHRLEELERHRQAHRDPPPASRSDWDVEGPWPRFSEARVAADVGGGFGVHWVDETAGGPRAARLGPRAELGVWRPQPFGINGGLSSTAVGGAIGYHALLRRGHEPIHRLSVELAVEFAGSIGRLAGGATVGAGWSHDLRTDADVDGLVLGGGLYGMARLHRRLDLALRVDYSAMVPFVELRRVYSHGADISLVLATYFGLR